MKKDDLLITINELYQSAHDLARAINVLRYHLNPSKFEKELKINWLNRDKNAKSKLAERDENAMQVLYDVLRDRTSWCTVKTIQSMCPEKSKGVNLKTIPRALNFLAKKYPDYVKKQKSKYGVQYRLTEAGKVYKDGVNFGGIRTNKLNGDQPTLGF